MFDIKTLMILVPALPLAATFITALLGKAVLRRQSHWPAVLGIGGAHLASLALLVAVYDISSDVPSHEGVTVANEQEAEQPARMNVAGRAASPENPIGVEVVHSLWTWGHG